MNYQFVPGSVTAIIDNDGNVTNRQQIFTDYRLQFSLVKYTDSNGNLVHNTRMFELSWRLFYKYLCSFIRTNTNNFLPYLNPPVQDVCDTGMLPHTPNGLTFYVLRVIEHESIKKYQMAKYTISEISSLNTAIAVLGSGTPQRIFLPLRNGAVEYTGVDSDNRYREILQFLNFPMKVVDIFLYRTTNEPLTYYNMEETIDDNDGDGHDPYGGVLTGTVGAYIPLS